MSFLEYLNKEQLPPVQHSGGPALVLAGAGSGKTRVITYRVAYLIDHLGELPYSIFAVTFTNKAADEMKERIAHLVSSGLRGLWVGTFHSMCARVLREFVHLTPFSSNFVIYDAYDQRNLIKRIMVDFRITGKKLVPRYVQRTISNLKDRLVDEYHFSPFGYEQIEIGEIYTEYQKRLLLNNAMDFDDLLFNTYRLLEENNNVREELDNRFKHKLVDEYQDTNHAQYMILKFISEKNRDLFVVGDDDQSIYGFRGADINNILDFEQEFPDSTVYRLQRNYRSTQMILRAASSVVKHNRSRVTKTLWTSVDEGSKLTLFTALDENEEARMLIRFLKKELSGRRKKDILIAYRTNAQSRAVEDALLREGIQYTIVGGLRFYQRKEIKDLLAYIKFITNKKDSVSFSRILNTPNRGIGKMRRDRIESYALKRHISLWEATAILSEDDLMLSNFVALISSLETIDQVDVLLELIIEKTGYLRLLEEEDTVEADSRIDNIRELLSTVKDVVSKKGFLTPEDYLREISLLTDIDEWNVDDSVTLMTLHNTKGLEFPVVFITGLSQDILPHHRSIKDGNIEEERRLFYVGLTRAKEKIYLSYFKMRGQGWGGIKTLKPSVFISELPKEVVDGLESHPGSTIFGDIPIRGKDEIGNGWVEHPIWGRGRILKTVDGDKLLISFNGMTKKIKKGFFK
ncbi:UvrD-helicase domain-containing protein [candidate division WOR-3 bacterium]|nr:UvrD-helicase domain-containing protein [candidate division WOR-3 bacterium]